MTVSVTDVDEFDVTTPTGNNVTNEIDENAVAGTVGITASASDADGTTNTVTYSLTVMMAAILTSTLVQAL